MDTHDELRNLAILKERADKTLLHRIETAQKVYWAVSILVVLITAVAIWVTTIRRDVDYHEKSIRKLWEKVFGAPLP